MCFFTVIFFVNTFRKCSTFIDRKPSIYTVLWRGRFSIFSIVSRYIRKKIMTTIEYFLKKSNTDVFIIFSTALFFFNFYQIEYLIHHYNIQILARRKKYITLRFFNIEFINLKKNNFSNINTTKTKIIYKHTW